MYDLNITFKKIKNEKNNYLVIFESIYFLDNINTFFELEIHDLINLMDFINMLQNHYKISFLNIEIEDQEFEMNHELRKFLRFRPF